MLVFKDMTDLWRRPLGDVDILAAYSKSASGRKSQYSVMLMDCRQLRWNIQEIVDQLDAGTLTYEQLMYESSLARTLANIEPNWNSLEAYKEGKTALLHYTDMNTQPWVSHLNPLGYLWVRTLRQAVRNGVISRAFVEDEVRRGHVRPSLLYQLDHKIDDAILLPKVALAADAGFTPPYRALVAHHASPWRSRLQWFRASMRAKYQTTLLYRLERRVLNRLKIQFGR
jgi:regulator of sigma D